MLKVAIRSLEVLVVLALLSGCASVVKGGNQKIAVTSDPSGARVVVTDLRQNLEVQSGTTPFEATLARGAGWFKSARYKVTFERPGYQNEEVLLEGRPSGWYLAGNLFFTDLLGWLVVDPLTGAMWVLEPQDLNVVMKKTAAGIREHDLRVVLLDDVPMDVKANLKLVRPGR